MRTVSVAPDAFVRCWRKLKIMLIYCCKVQWGECTMSTKGTNEAGETALNTAADTGGTADHSV